MKPIPILGMFTLGLTLTTFMGTRTVNAQIIELGDDVRVDFSNQRRRRNRTNVRVYGDNGRLTVGVEELESALMTEMAPLLLIFAKKDPPQKKE